MARILLLEDDPDQLVIRKLLLENAGHQVRTAASVADAIDEGGYDVIIMDLVPGCDDLLAHIPETTPLVVLSGRQIISEQLTARGACVLRKPCPSRTLIETVGRLCHEHHG
jgi:DNA-binding response OmpR family regulator